MKIVKINYQTRRLALLLVLILMPSLLQAQTNKNVLLITIDDLNCNLGTYGHPLVKSPHIDALASKAIRFDRAYCQAPQCTPSRSSFLTGLYPEQIGVIGHGPHFRDLIPKVKTLPQLFKENGYFSARVGKIFHYGVPSDIGTDGLDDPVSWDLVVNPRGIDKDYEDTMHNIDPGDPNIGGILTWLSIDSEDEEHTDGIATIEAIKLLKENNPKKTEKPFFLGVGYYRPHVPFITPTKYFDLYPKDKITLVENQIEDRNDIPLPALADRPNQLTLSEDKQREIIQAYYASITYIDGQVGKLLDELDRLDLTDSTIILLLSDHGYHMGRHGLWQKSDLFEDGVRAPLIIAAPGVSKPGTSTSSLIEFVDLYPTVVELVGLIKPDYLSGKSLVPILKDPEQTIRDSAYTMAPAFSKVYPDLHYRNIIGYTIRTDRFRYTQWGPDGVLGEELYDYDNDPGELTNLTRNRTFESTRYKLRRQLHVRMAEAQVPVYELED